MEPTLTGTVLITGAASGIGAATATAAAQAGAAVALLDRDTSAVTALAVDLSGAGHRARALTCDVSDPGRVKDAVTTVTDDMGPITGLVTCAGIEISGWAHDMPVTDWQHTIEVNLSGTYYTCRETLAARPEDTTTPLSIVLVSSPAALVALGPDNTAYAASKAGVLGLVRQLARAYAPHVRVNAVIPGSTDTQLMWATTPPADRDRIRAEIENALPLGRLAEPEEIAEPVLFLLGRASRYITGAPLIVDGGLTANGVINV